MSKAQSNLYANLRLIYPANLTYDTLLIKDAKGKTVSETTKAMPGGKMINTYLINVGSINVGSFSIYFGGSSSNVNDTLYFQSRGKDLGVELKDSFALRDKIDLELVNVFNFEKLYNNYNQYCDLRMQKYDTAVKTNPSQNISRQEYLLKAGFDFVRENVTNPYNVELFSVFIINPSQFNVGYAEANQFYIKYLKPAIQNSRARKFVEEKIEALKHSLIAGNQAPSFSAHSINNKLINNETLLGKNVLLIFWATWCVPCMQEIPSLKQIHEEYKDDNLVMVSVSLDSDSLKMITEVNEQKLDWTQIFNSKFMLGSFRINPIPATFLIDEKGVIIYNSISSESGNNLAELKSLLRRKFKPKK